MNQLNISLPASPTETREVTLTIPTVNAVYAAIQALQPGNWDMIPGTTVSIHRSSCGTMVRGGWENQGDTCEWSTACRVRKVIAEAEMQRWINANSWD